MKVMSIIGIVWFSLSLIFVIALAGNYDFEAAAGWGVLGLLYALPLAIVGLVKSSKSTYPKINVGEELLKLNELKEKGVIAQEEFNHLKAKILA